MRKKQIRKFSIFTQYRRGKAVVKTNSAVHADRAVLHAVDHMQLNKYDATVAEVFSESTGLLHAVIRRSVTGNISVMFKRGVK